MIGAYFNITYEDPSELDIEFKLDALWLVSDERGVILGTTSCERCILGATTVRFLLHPLSKFHTIKRVKFVRKLTFWFYFNSFVLFF